MLEFNPDPGGWSHKITRRAFLLGATSAAGGLYFLLRENGTPVEARMPNGPPKEVTIVEFSDSGQPQRVVRLSKIVKTESEWKNQLSPAAFEITRHADTEHAFTGQYWDLHEKGLYRCICCDTALFSSETKFESGTGWPSFWQPIAQENIEKIVDRSFMMERTAVSCRRCDAHLGHVFDDGPKPTGLRYCMNSASLRFVKVA